LRVAAVASLAIVALLLAGWRKPARAEPVSPRQSPAGHAAGIVVDHLGAPAYRRPGIARRLLAVLASSGLAVLIGMLMAIVVAFAVALAVIWMTSLLG
jgi:ABC-type nitrate/sulfonate/bicarbonate transport system permease component